jgi:hypothetical protein
MEAAGKHVIDTRATSAVNDWLRASAHRDRSFQSIVITRFAPS